MLLTTAPWSWWSWGSGSGKATVGKRLAERRGWNYQEGDALHPPENVAKMSSGTPLSDTDRIPWLRRSADRIRRLAQQQQ